MPWFFAFGDDDDTSKDGSGYNEDERLEWYSHTAIFLKRLSRQENEKGKSEFFFWKKWKARRKKWKAEFFFWKKGKVIGAVC